MSDNYVRGSEWRKWDLHVHTPSSYDYKYRGDDADELLIKAWREHEFAAVAITDHFLIDKERICSLRSLASEITIFPGVELRTDKGASNLHVILIFAEDIALNDLCNDFDAIMRRQNAKAADKEETIYWDYDDIIEFAKNHDAIISLHAGKKSNGVDDMITNATPVAMAIKSEYAESVDIYEMGKVKDIEEYHKHVLPQIGDHALILCSDNHDSRQYILKDTLWIKGNPTFSGLKQTLLHPKERVFVGTKPTKLEQVTCSPTTFIDSINIRRIEEPRHSDEHWFECSIPMNSGLTAIIGNKGSGKSALADIVGHACKCHSMNEASFLDDTRFRKLPENRSRDYVVTLKWLDGKVDTPISLNKVDYGTTIENAQYLPQRYIEKVCNDLGAVFQTEINNVIFSYVDDTEKGDARNLEELVANKSKGIIGKIREIQSKIEEKNREMIHTEERLVPSYLMVQKDNLAKREDDLQRHDLSRPKEIEKPKNSQNQDYKEKLEKINVDLEVFEETISQKKEALTNVNARIDELVAFIQKIETAMRSILALNLELNSYAEQNNYPKGKMQFSIETPVEWINEEIKKLRVQKNELSILLDATVTEKRSLIYAQTLKLKEKEELIEITDSKEKVYQKYLADLKNWEEAKKRIIGDFTTTGSIEYLKKDIDYIEKEIEKYYLQLKDERNKQIEQLFKYKQEIATIFQELYTPVERELEELLGDIDSGINFSVDISLTDSQIGEKILLEINQSLKGIFLGKAEAIAKMRELLEETNFNDVDSVISFITNVEICITENYETANKKVKDKESFYSLLTNLDYINAEYKLKLEGRTLKELSPGERGIVLLVFYLALNKNESPLLIDQPEDNLDNQSVYSKLVPCILAAKKKRQVIIVTHNPNIAIACDAEQIVYCSMDKSNNHITYVSGAIEDELTCKHIVDVLEGTMPAFNLRKQKYAPMPKNQIV